MSGEWQCPGCNYETEAHCDNEHVYDCLVSKSAEVFRLREEKNAAYRERDRLVHLLASLYPSWLARHPDSDVNWEDEWRWIVFIKLPTGQASWHIHESELEWFKEIGLKECVYDDEPVQPWDGHTTDEKYVRVYDAARENAKAGRYCAICGEFR